MLSGIPMIKVLTEEEELAYRRESFKRLSPGCLFNLGGRKYFVAVRKLNESSWEVIELDKENLESIIKGQVCRRSTLSFDDMICLNICNRNALSHD